MNQQSDRSESASPPRRRFFRQAYRFLIAVALLVGAVAVGVDEWLRSHASVYCTFDSPDGRYSVVVVRIPGLLAMPGDSGGASGTVWLIDRQDRRVLAVQDVDMVQTIDRVYWSPRAVDIALFAEWPLPP